MTDLKPLPRGSSADHGIPFAAKIIRRMRYRHVFLLFSSGIRGWQRLSVCVLLICRNEMEISLKSLSLTQVCERKDQSNHLAFPCTINGIGLLYFNLWPVLVEN